MNTLLNKWKLVRPILRYVLLIIVATDTLINYKTCSVNYIIILLLALILIIYTYKSLGFSSSPKKPVSFILISIIISTFIMCTLRNPTFIYVYYFILMDDIFEIAIAYQLRYKLLFVHFLGILLKFFIYIFPVQAMDLSQKIHQIIAYVIYYVLILWIYIIVHINKDEGNKLKILNSNLIEYSFKERAYLISEERSRISQELHDSLGHLLIALSMNVRYVKAVKNKKEIDPELNEIEALIQESIQTLRNTVYCLKELESNLNLYEEIKTITTKFSSLDIIKINLDYNNEIEKASEEIKNTLLTTIKEGITNSIKHGNASEINISIDLIDDSINFVIIDNGTGCKNIINSNGLNGIIKRFQKINGEAYFTSTENRGFSINAIIHGGFSND